MITLTIPGPPITKKNSQIPTMVNGRPMILPSKDYQRYEKEALLQLGLRRMKDRASGKKKTILLPGCEPPPRIDGPVSVKVLYWLPTNRRPDLLNLLQATADILEAAGIIANDRDIVSFDGSRIMGKSHQPRAEIEIERVEFQRQIFGRSA